MYLQVWQSTIRLGVVLPVAVSLCRHPHHEILKGESEGTICLESGKFARFPRDEDTVARPWLKTSRISSAVLPSGEWLVRPHCCSKEFHHDREM